LAVHAIYISLVRIELQLTELLIKEVTKIYILYPFFEIDRIAMMLKIFYILNRFLQDSNVQALDK